MSVAEEVNVTLSINFVCFHEGKRMTGRRSSGVLIMFLVGLSFLMIGPSLSYGQDGGRSGLDWLRDNKIPVRSDEVVVEGTIFTIVPASKRMVIKSGNPQKTLVLGFMDNVEVSNGKSKIALDSLARGNSVVVILRKTSYARAIFQK